MEEEAANRLLSLFTGTEEEASQDNISRIRSFREKLGEALSPEVSDGLIEIIETVEKTLEGREGTPAFRLSFDPTLVRGMGYYTGPIFEISTPEFGSSVGGGGRYDEMVGRFLGQPVPACGFSIGFERIISILMDQGFQVPGAGEKVAYLLDKRLSADQISAVMRKAEEERAKGAVVLTQKMAKNRKFQRETLEASGYARIVDFYADRPISG